MQFTRISILIASLVIAISGCQSKDPSKRLENVAALPEGITLLETVEKGSAGGIVIPYKKYELDNGLTVILHEDLSDPLVHVDITYHVGSGREEVGKSGFAHFFEHMMFQGSENVDDEEHFKIVSESGGTLNGSTNTDRTNYFETVPANQLEKMLWLEADRMGFFLDAVTQEKFEVQRETVKNERGQRVDNQPYGQLNERINEAMYPEGHPYSWQTIGYIEDLNRVDVNDLKEFFLRWYGPNNATLTIGGKFDAAETLAWVSKYFAPIPRGPEVANPEIPVVTLETDRYLSMEDNVALPLLYMAFPTVHLYHEDEAPLDVLMYVLGQGETSLLYKNVVKNGLAVNASAGHGCQELSCTFTVFALPNPASGTTLADLERIVRASLDEFETRGVVDDDLTRVKMDIVSGMIYSLESAAGKVGRLASHQTYTGNPNFTGDDIARYENVTKEDVMRVYRQYIKGKSAVVMSIVPPGQMSMIAREDSWSRFERDLPDYTPISEEDLAFRRAKDDFDRSVMPPSGDNPSVVLPVIWRAELDNGIEVLGAGNSETPTVAIQLRIEAGQRSESLDKLGLAAMTAAMLNESTTQRTNEELSNELQKLGAMVQFGAGNDNTILTIRSLSEHLDETLAIAENNAAQIKQHDACVQHQNNWINFENNGTYLFIPEICSGVVPQHPPIIFAPASMISFTYPAISAGVSWNVVSPSEYTGIPAFAWINTGIDWFIFRISFTMPIISAIPFPQFAPMIETPASISVSFISAGEDPIIVLYSLSEILSKVIVQITSQEVFSLAAFTAILASSRSVIVSITIASAPPNSRAMDCSLKAS